MQSDGQFLIRAEVMETTSTALSEVITTFRDAVAKIEEASEKLFDGDNWRGEARNEFYNTYVIIQHNLQIDEQQVSSLSEIIKGIKDVYDATDFDTAKQIISTVGDAFSENGKSVAAE